MRERQGEFIACLDHVDRESAPAITQMHVGLDNVRRPKGQPVQAWLSKQARFVLPFRPVHCAWLKQGEQGGSIVQRQRWRIAACADKQPRAERLMAFGAAWHEQAPPLHWSTPSVAQVRATCAHPGAKAA